MTVSWKDRSIAYSMLLQGASAQETARRFRVNTGAVVQWARLAGMVIRMGARGGVISNVTAPFGGIKQYGLGREGALEGMEEYLYTQYIGIADPYVG